MEGWDSFCVRESVFEEKGDLEATQAPLFAKGRSNHKITQLVSDKSRPRFVPHTSCLLWKWDAVQLLN